MEKNRFVRGRYFPLLLFLTMLLLATSFAHAQGSAFTYQGKLTDAGNPANGTYDMQFKLFDTPTVGTGTQQGSTLTNPSVQVAAGIFTVQLDFGANLFDGSARYLEIAVRPEGNPNPHTILAPRQPITSSPYAIQTINTQQLGGLPANRYVATDVNGNVGIGTNSPTAKLSVSGTGAFNAPGAPRFDLFNTTAGTGFLQHVTDTGLWQIATTTGATRVAINQSGNIGIGTLSPLSKLHIQSGASDLPPRLQSSGTTGMAAGWDFYLGVNPKGYVGAPDSSSAIAPGELLLFGGPGTKTSLWAGGNRSVTLDTNGNVGIGTADPFHKLQVETSSGSAIGGRTSQPSGFGVFGHSTASSGVGIGVWGETSSPNGYAGIFVGRVHVSGNVGIGTSSPTAKLTVSGAGAFNAPGAPRFDLFNATANTGFLQHVTDTGLWQMATTGGATRMVIDPSGNVGIGTPTPQRLLHVNGRARIAEIPQEAWDGHVCFNNAGDLLSCTFSTLRAKTNVHAFSAGLDIVRRLRPINFTWKENGQPGIGLGAEEVAEVAPSLVELNSKGEVSGVKYERLNMLLINAIKDQQTQIEAQKNLIESQQRQIEALTKLTCQTNPQAEICKEK